MEYLLIVLAIFIFAAGLIRYWIAKDNKKRKARLNASFGKVPPDGEFEAVSISMYDFYKKDVTQGPRIDDITWNDLEMDRVFSRVNACNSSAGEEYLYNRLRMPQFEAGAFEAREELIAFFDSHPDERLQAMTALAKLGKRNYNGLPGLIFGHDRKPLPYPHLYKILSILPFAGAALLFFSQTIGVMSIILVFAINMTVYFLVRRRLNQKIPVVEYLRTLLICCGRLCGIKSMQPHTAELNRLFSFFRPMIGKLPAFANPFAKEMEMLAIYPKILFLVDERRYNRAIKTLSKYNDEFIALYEALAEIDAALSILSYRKSLPQYTIPEFSDTNAIEFDGMFHPLLDRPVTNDGIITKNGLITGSNASGKSTFIKALAVNGILAQTINTCAAARFKTRPSLVVTSMAMRDDISGGESYFIVEVKSMKRILDYIGEYPCACYIDEILRGTNTIERIAASTAVLEYIHKKDCLCVAATHDIELTSILADKYSNYHFSERISDDGIVFDYKLKDGPAATRNAIKLLGFMAFDREIVERAEELTRGKTSY